MGELDYDAFFGRLYRTFDEPGGRDSMRDLLEGTRVRVWVDREDHRVLQMQLAYPDPEGETEIVELQYREVEIPSAVESMDAEEAHRLGQEAEPGAQRILLAIADYRVPHGSYPPSLDQHTLGAVLPASEWPTNPFSRQPVRQAPTEPGGFEYRLISSGEHFQFTLNGWDDSILHYDSARFGPVPPEALRYR